MMRTFKLFLLLILQVALILSSCSRKTMPARATTKNGRDFNQAAFNSFFVEGTKQKLMGNMGEALKYFEQCLQMNPGSDATYYQMAQIMLNNGDAGHGKKYIKKAVDLQPGNLWYQMTLAGVYYQQKNLDSAIICYEQAVKTYPEKESLQISLANLYTESQKYEKARGILDRFDKKYGVNDNTTLSLIRALMAEKKYSEARVKIDQLLSGDPGNIIYNGLLAEIYRVSGEKEKAFGVYKQLMDRNPGDPQVQLSLCDFM